MCKMESQEAPSKKRPKLDEVLWEKKKNNFTSKVNSSMYLDEKTADVYFICGAEGERIPAHKNVLSKSSPYFDAMFYGPNKSECDKDYAKWSPGAFKDFLKLCYLDEVAIRPNNIIEVMELAHESQMFESLKLCGELWADNMTIDDVFRAYHWAMHFKMDEFKEHCERKISAYPEQVFKTTDFLSCDRVILNRILEFDTLLCDEKIVLQACLNWASKACERDGLNASEMNNLRIYLEDSLYKIRYSSMTPQEFRRIMDSKDGFYFDIDECMDIIRLTTKSVELKTGRFNPNPRSYEIAWKESRAIECNTFNRLKLSTQIIRNHGKLSMTLRSSQPILLGGFHWAPLENSNDSAKVTIEITQKSSIPKIILTTVIELVNNSEPFLDLANSPIVLRPEFEHYISFVFDLAGSRERQYYASDIDTEIKLDEETTIFISPPGNNIVRGFKFNLL